MRDEKLKTVPKADLEWLRKKGFRKERGELWWRLNMQDAGKNSGRAPFFHIDAVYHEKTKQWHARISVIKHYEDPYLSIMPDTMHNEMGVPDGWDEDFLDADIGYATGCKTASEAVMLALYRAAGFVRWLSSGDYYNVFDLELELKEETEEE